MNGVRQGDTVFLKQIGTVVLAAAVLSVYPLMTRATAEIAEAVIAGGVLSVVNVLMGYAVVRISAGKPQTEFMQVVLAGIAVRLFVMVGLMLLAVGVLRFHAFALISSLFVMYSVFLIVEVLYIHNHIKQS
ncbi:MAG: hypothetical protein HUU02_06485 [Bacteroidetes bacterium]|nr:hypothetical protein [Bacteroidota bacterium]